MQRQWLHPSAHPNTITFLKFLPVLNGSLQAGEGPLHGLIVIGQEGMASN